MIHSYNSPIETFFVKSMVWLLKLFKVVTNVTSFRSEFRGYSTFVQNSAHLAQNFHVECNKSQEQGPKIIPKHII